MTDKINKIPHLPKLELQNTHTSKFNATLRIKQLKKDLQLTKSLNAKKNSEQRPIVNSEDKIRQTPKIRRSHKLLAPMVLDPYKSKMKNENVLNQKNIKVICMSEKKKEKNYNSATKTTSSIQRQSSKQSNRTAVETKNIKKIKQFLKNYVSKQNEKNSESQHKLENLDHHNENILNEQQQKLIKANKKRQMIDKVTMKGKYRCRINQVVFQQKPPINSQKNVSTNYWNNVLQSDISFKQENQLNDESLTMSFLNVN